MAKISGKDGACTFSESTVKITSWTLNENAGVKDVSDSNSSGVSEFISDEFSDWDVTFEGFSEGGDTPPAIGTAAALVLTEKSGQTHSGSAIITSRSTALQVKGGDAVKRSYTAQGTGTLSNAYA
jgi:hypothetical protein